jgi:hypothetical protein
MAIHDINPVVPHAQELGGDLKKTIVRDVDLYQKI